MNAILESTFPFTTHHMKACTLGWGGRPLQLWDLLLGLLDYRDVIQLEMGIYFIDALK